MAQQSEVFVPCDASQSSSASLRSHPSPAQGEIQPSMSPRLEESGYSSTASPTAEFNWATSPKFTVAANTTTTEAPPASYQDRCRIRDSPQINQYKYLLEKLADRLSCDDVDRLKRQCGVPAGTAERMRNNRDFMQWLINKDKINPNDLSFLGLLLHYVKRPDLVEKVRRYEEDRDIPLERRTPTIEPSSTEPEETTSRQTYANDMAERLNQLRERIERRREEGRKTKQRATMIVITVCLCLLILIWPLFWLDDLPYIRGKLITMVWNSGSGAANVVNKIGPSVTVLGETIFGLALMFTVCWLRQDAMFQRLREDFLSDLELLMQPAKKRVKKRGTVQV